MDIPIQKSIPLEAPASQAWAVLSDIRAVAACMPGAAITEELTPTQFKGTVKSKVGPATMNFAGTIEVLQLDLATRTLEMLGKGADRGGSSATMKLLARIEPGSTAAHSLLIGEAQVSVSGKLAQFGNRLLVPVADALLDQFAANFRAAALALAAPATDNTITLMVQSGQAPGAAQPGPAPAPRAPVPVRELNALALLWTVIKNWFAGLFGRR